MSAAAVAPKACAAIPSLDGIRALAVGLVFFAHSGLEHLVPGGLGVTVFFVLSGFLITTLLRQEQERSNAISLRNFYLRRWLRLMPPLLAVVCAAALLAAASIIDGGFTPAGLMAVLFYFGNYHVILHDFQGLPAGLGVVWSLAVEEHYYLLYPPLAALLLHLKRPQLSALLLGALCAGVLWRRCWLAGHGASADYLGMATDTRIDAILVGCMLGLAQNPWLDRIPDTLRRREGALLLLCAGLLAASLLCRDEYFRITGRYTVQSLAIAPLIYYAVAHPDGRAFHWLQAPLPAYLGRVSYTIYLSHHLLLLLVQRDLPQAGWAITMLLTAVLTLAVAEAMRRWVEQPIMALRLRLRQAPVPRTPEPASGITTPS